MTAVVSIDLNADVGEGFGIWTLGDDAALLDVVTSANVACGFHGGDPQVMRRTCSFAVERGVRIGAHVSYPDLVGFGRRPMRVDSEELLADVIYQLGALDAFARLAGDRVRYVKPHGALYNALVTDVEQAEAVAAAVAAVDATLPILGLPGSAIHAAARRAGLPTAAEAFADRAYTHRGTLVPRSEPGAVLHDPTDIAERCVRLADIGALVAIDGTELAVAADSICVHGDTPGAVEIARGVRAALATAGIAVRPFVDRHLID